MVAPSEPVPERRKTFIWTVQERIHKFWFSYNFCHYVLADMPKGSNPKKNITYKSRSVLKQVTDSLMLWDGAINWIFVLEFIGTSDIRHIWTNSFHNPKWNWERKRLGKHSTKLTSSSIKRINFREVDVCILVDFRNWRLQFDQMLHQFLSFTCVYILWRQILRYQ